VTEQRREGGAGGGVTEARGERRGERVKPQRLREKRLPGLNFGERQKVL